MKRLSLVLLIAAIPFLSLNAQFVDCTSGLLLCPSAEMASSGTFMVTNNFLNKHYTANNGNFGWNYHTFSYGFSITFWSRLEVAYACTIFNGDWNPDAVTKRQMIIKNQDRHLAAKFQFLREGDFKSWTPSIVFGTSDPVTGSTRDGLVTESGNGYFNRYYFVATKHLNTKWGIVGTHLGYQFNVRDDPHYNAPCIAIDWVPIWVDSNWFSPKLILEFDSRTANFGFISSVFDGRLETMFVVENMRWVNFGLRYKVQLDGAE